MPILSITVMPVGSNGGNGGDDAVNLAISGGPRLQLSEPTLYEAKQGSDERRRRIFLLHNRRFEAMARPFEKWLERFFRSLQREVNANINDNWKGFFNRTHNLGPRKFAKYMAENKVEFENLNFDIAKATAQMIEEGLPFVSDIVIQSGEFALETLAISGIAFDVANPKIAEFLARRENLLVKIPNSVFDKIRLQLIEGIDAGESVNALQTRLLDNVWNQSQARSLKVARTESATAKNSGDLMAWGQSGVVEAKGWLTAGDDVFHKR